MTAEHVWYVAYGSNLHRPRLQRYLDRAPDARAPVDRRPVTLPHRLFFAEWSARWDGGRAYVDPRHDPRAGTLAVAWLLRVEQFRSVLAQENGRATLDVELDLAGLAPGDRHALGVDRYGVVVGCESPDHRPAVTFTTPADPLPAATQPSAAYVDVIVAGLVAAHGLPEAAARAYVVARTR